MYLSTSEEINVTTMAELWKIPIQAYPASLTGNLAGITVWMRRAIISKVIVYFLTEDKDFAFF